MRTSASWPVADSYVAHVEEKRDDNGFLVVTLAYTYKVADERYVGRESFPFLRDNDAAVLKLDAKNVPCESTIGLTNLACRRSPERARILTCRNIAITLIEEF